MDGSEEKDKLDDRQLSFCREYVVDCNATQAYIRAGYSPNGASVSASRLLANAKIKAEIERLTTEKAERVAKNADDVIQQYVNIAFADIREVIQFGPDGVKLIDSGLIPPNVAQAIKSIKQTKDGVTVTMESKQPALDRLAELLGIGGGAKVTGDININIPGSLYPQPKDAECSADTDPTPSS